LITLGIDLASQPRNTAMATIEWLDDRAVANEPTTGVTDDAALEAMKTADRVGIDAPFGWPDDFVAALPGFSGSGTWSATELTKLRFRITDRYVRDVTDRWPLSVSSDLIAIPAFRCAGLLSAAYPGGIDRIEGHAVEVYPGAALTQWGLERRGYKTDPAIRERLVDAIGECVDVSAAREACIAGDHALDAVIAALITRAAALGQTLPPEGDRDVIQREGWIHIPAKGDLRVLDPRRN
jgi:predicted nuclease with RNAse H fold